MEPNPDKELTTSEVAKTLGFSETAVLLWVKKGLLRVRVTPGGHRRYRWKDVDDFAAKLSNGDFRAASPTVDVKLGRMAASLVPDKPGRNITIPTKKPGIKPGRKASNRVR